MLKKQREQEIISLMRSGGGFAAVKELCRKLYVSESGIRRDLNELEKKGIIHKVYGGAELVPNVRTIPSFSERSHHNIEAKRQIAKKAKGLIHDGRILFLDQSSTCYYLAEAIADNATLTVVTNNIEILNLLSASPMRVIASGGMISSENRNCLVGADARYIFENMYADMVFFSTKSLSDDGTISDCSREEVALRSAMLEHAQRKLFLCDNEKIGTCSPYVQTTLAKVDGWVCENEKECAARFSPLFPSLTVY